MTREQLRIAYAKWQKKVEALRGVDLENREAAKQDMESARGQFFSLLPAFFKFGTMSMDEYQESADATAVYPGKGSNYLYPVLGLAGESGEVCEKMKKVIRDKGGKMDDESRGKILDEVGDVLWYVSQLARELDSSLDEVARRNIEKLSSRKERGVLKGSGDER